jgi:DNA (cytosine-5)-methyltransferase 1
LNAKNHGVPQNRERVFLIGIRDDLDNNFQFPREEHLTKRLKDVLEEEILRKFYLSDLAIEKCLKSQANKDMLIKEVSDISKCIVAGYYKIPFDGQYIKVESNLEKYYLSEKMINHLDKHERSQEFINQETINVNCITANYSKQSSDLQYLKIKYNDKRLNETIEKNELNKGEIKMLDTYNKSIHDECPTLKARHAQNNDRKLWDGYKIRRLTPRECFRLMDFPDTFTWNVSDSQAYKQAGNSIVVNVLYKIIKNLNL